MKRRTFLASGAALAITPLLPKVTLAATDGWLVSGFLTDEYAWSMDLNEASLEKMLISIAQSGVRLAAVPTMLIRDQG